MKKFFRNNLNRIALNIFFIVMTAIMVWSSGVDNIKEYYVGRSTYTNDFNYTIYGNSVLMQNFKCDVAGANEFELKVMTSRNLYQGYFTVALHNADGDLLQKWDTPKTKISKDEWVGYKLQSPLEKGESYSIIITASGLDKNSAIQILGTNTSNLINRDENIVYDGCFYNGDTDGCVAFSLCKSKLNVFAIVAIALIFILINLCLSKRGQDIEKYSFAAMTIMGLIMLLVVAPGAGPDEDYHYCSSIMLSNALLGRENITEIEKEYEFEYDRHVNSNANFEKVYSNLFRSGKIDNTITTLAVSDRINQLKYPAAYIIPASGMAVGRTIGLNGVQVYQLGRLFNLLGYILICWYAIRIIPKYKELVFLFAINPMAMQQASSLSYDALINGLSTLFVAYIIKLIVEEKYVSWVDILKLVFITILFGPIKTVYYVHIVLLLFIPYHLYKNRIDKYVKFIASIGIIGVLSILASKVQQMSVIASVDNSKVEAVKGVAQNAADNVVPSISATAQERYYTVADVLGNPIDALSILINSFEKHFVERLQEAFGVRLGASTYIPEYIVYIFVISLLICAMYVINKEGALDIRARIGMLFVAIAEIGLISAAGFLMTTYGLDLLEGIQGRYYIPCIIVLLLAFTWKKINLKMEYTTIMLMVSYVYLGSALSVMSQIECL